ncbi:MAG: type II CAAX endopeptidase family protein [Methylovulum sp.]|nr:type II CAAX endopeptidase family protein [Methylovulum sp.]
MRNLPFQTGSFFKAACYFEASLIILAVLLGWIADINPFQHIYFSILPIVYGVLGTVPLFLMFLSMQNMQDESIVSIRKFLLDTLGPNLSAYQWPHLLLLGAIAGLSEELLFRGVIQPWLEPAWGATAGLLVSNLIFGLVHTVTPMYAVLAAVVGIYLGLAMDFGGDRNLLTPIIIHGLYDFLAFVALMRTYRAGLPTAS